MCFFLLIGGRGYLQEVWLNYPNTNAKLVRDTFNQTNPVKSTRSVEYGVQDFSNTEKYEVKYQKANARLVWFNARLMSRICGVPNRV